MKVLILGVDGYLGWPLALRLISKGHEVVGFDNYYRRHWVGLVGGASVVPLAHTLNERMANARIMFHHYNFNLMQYEYIHRALRDERPDAIVHLAEQPSAPFSMRSPECCYETQQNNVLGTLNLLWAMKEECPRAHLVKLGTMGEYGTPDVQIPEGHFPTNSYWGKGDGEIGDIAGLPFPRQPGSFYHASKVHDSVNIDFACRVWGLRSTDIMQGVVYGTQTSDTLHFNSPTRFDIDECFGTVINRFCAQAIVGMPLTVYGKGQQQRGFLPLHDSIKCLTLVLNNPPQQGEYRVFNQFAQVYSIRELAERVAKVACDLNVASMDLSKPDLEHVPNPRVEKEEHFYQPAHDKLQAMGYKPTLDCDGVIETMLEDLLPYKDRIEDLRSVLTPKTNWR